MVSCCLSLSTSLRRKDVTLAMDFVVDTPLEPPPLAVVDRGAPSSIARRRSSSARSTSTLSCPYSALIPVSYTHLRAHETPEHLVCRLLLEKKKKKKEKNE
eukprot:TRINITY_DN14941_c0_g1_i1.p1 TRINITY_DN14941_c0_g1~~TRINITY_DN14941_c0_g1_i1.p1  ORF type:complete len:101 (-),score=24.19 TRINITY_DN14941_c0_g1_i1:67-369(-)